MTLRAFLRRLRRDRRGATAIEYGLIAALIFLAAVSGVSLLAGATTRMWGIVAGAVERTAPGG